MKEKLIIEGEPIVNGKILGFCFNKAELWELKKNKNIKKKAGNEATKKIKKSNNVFVRVRAFVI